MPKRDSPGKQIIAERLMDWAAAHKSGRPFGYFKERLRAYVYLYKREEGQIGFSIAA